MDKVTAWAIGGVAAILVTGFVVITVTGNATSDYLILLGGPAVSGLLGSLILKRQATVQADVAEVKHATNGLMDARFADVGEKLDAAATDRQEIAAALSDVQSVVSNGNTTTPAAGEH
jgi:hypothetical protein